MHGAVKDVLDSKGHHVVTVSVEMTAHEAVEVMIEYGIGAVLILERDMPIGIFTERDVLRRIVVPRLDARELDIGSVMSSPVKAISPSMQVHEAMRMMTSRRFRHLPVMEGQRLVGLVSIGDLTNWVTRDLTAAVDQLESYIMGPSL